MQKPVIFISYSHKDEDEKVQLVKQLAVLKGTGIEAWCDDLIKAGDHWEERIRATMAEAHLAVLMISANFLTSDFILNQEVPYLLERNKNDSLIVFPIIAKPCAWPKVDWLMRLNLRPKNGIPIWGRGTADADEELAKITTEIAGMLAVQGPPSPGTTASKPQSTIIKTNMVNTEIFFTDTQNRLWLSDGNEVKVFRVDLNNPIGRWPLARKRFKAFLPESWNYNLVASDYDGNLYTVGGTNQSQFRIFHQAKERDAPFHLIRVGPDGRLVAGSYDGRVSAWGWEGEEPQQYFSAKLDSLPIRLLPLADSDTIALDQARILRRLDPRGNTLWSWPLEQLLNEIWAQDSNTGSILFGLTDKQEIVSIDTEHKKIILLDRLLTPFYCLSHNVTKQDDPCTVFVCRRDENTKPDRHCMDMDAQGSVVEWFSWSAMRLLNNCRLDLEGDVRQIVALNDPENPYAYIAMGMIEDGRMVSMVDRNVSYHPTEAHSLSLDPSGRFVFLIMNQAVEVIRNPAIQPARCEIELLDYKGTLIVNEYKSLLVRLKNTGKIPINSFLAVLSGQEMTVAKPLKIKQSIAPEEELDLRFSVKALAVGDAVPVKLNVEMHDELGPPMWKAEFALDLESKKKE